MPRRAREKSASDIYHVMLRGINQQTIFECEEDNQKFLQTLKAHKAISKYEVYAYCLMGNHAHLLLKVNGEDLPTIFKRIGGSYVYWYNWKYHRVGHLFQDRFKSEPIEDETYFLTALRYIHQNPVKAGLCQKVNEYTYTSYHDYIVGNDNLVDVDFVFGMMDQKQFIEFNDVENDDKCLEMEKVSRLTDHEAKEIIEKMSNCKNIVEFQNLNIIKRNAYIKDLHKRGLSIRQISRLTGISKGIVERNI